MSDSPLASFLLPEGFSRPGLGAVLRESSIVSEAGRYAVRTAGEHRFRRGRAHVARATSTDAEPVILVPGFMAGDGTLALMSRTLRARGFRTYRSHIHVNVGCTLDAAMQLEARIEAIAHGIPVVEAVKRRVDPFTASTMATVVTDAG